MRKISEILAGFSALPEANISTILDSKRPLILAPHPDDESLGCGGLIAAACSIGLTPSVVVLTDGSASHPDSKLFPPERLARLREKETMDATRVLGLPAENLHFLRYIDTALPDKGDEFYKAIACLQKIGYSGGCGLIVGPWAGDPHCDHEAAAKIALALSGIMGWKLLSYAVWGWLRSDDDIVDEPRTGGWRLDVSNYQERKRRAISAHASQCGQVIKDSPNGFILPTDLRKIFEKPFEVFIV